MNFKLDIFHDVLERFKKQFGGRELPERLRRAARDVLTEYYDETIGSIKDANIHFILLANDSSQFEYARKSFRKLFCKRYQDDNVRFAEYCADAIAYAELEYAKECAEMLRVKEEYVFQNRAETGTSVRYVSPLEFRRLIWACDDDDSRATIALAYYAGMRLPEILELRCDNVVEKPDGSSELRFNDAKTNEARVVAINDELWQTLRRLFARPILNGLLVMRPDIVDQPQALRLASLASVDPIPRLLESLRHSRLQDVIRENQKGN